MSDYNTLLYPEIGDYLQNLMSNQPQALEALGTITTQSVTKGHMRISAEQAQLMQVLLRMHQTKCVLEIGMFTGYSALAMALAIPEDGKLVSCDYDMTHYDLASKYWQQAQVDHKITVMEGQALSLLEQSLSSDYYESYFDWVFIDADKANYPNYVEACLPLLKQGGVMALDNTLHFGCYVHQRESHAAQIVDDLNYQLREDKRFSVSVIPIGGGLTLAYKL